MTPQTLQNKFRIQFATDCFTDTHQPSILYVKWLEHSLVERNQQTMPAKPQVCPQCKAALQNYNVLYRKWYCTKCKEFVTVNQ